jgi:5-carboxymethyl-2-hydroxymuconate isomerase
MRVGKATVDGAEAVVVDRNGEWIALTGGFTTDELFALQPSQLASLAATSGEPCSEPRLLAPLRPGKIVAIGLNYLDHIRETGMEQPAAPLIFAKFPSSVIGPDQPIRIPRALTQRVDWEVELAVVIGKRARLVSEDTALEHVFGYTVANDVSARDLQFADGQWVRGKSLDTFCPIGPVIVTADEIPDPARLRLGTDVNGTVVQDSTTAEMVFGVAKLISYCSASFTLEPGDLLLTGTPWGCGEFMSPPRSLTAGDVVETYVERIGTLTNPVEEV